jgi:hypothetical protein
MHLFLDTNIWLGFYHLPGGDLEELRKLGVLLDQNRVTLWLPDQIVDEFRRNRDGVIAEAIAGLGEELPEEECPQLCADYPEHARLREAAEQHRRARSALYDRLRADARNGRLKADGIISELFARARRVPISDALWERARRRYDLGNPPGKEGSYGDAVNWECLLAGLPDRADLCLVTADRDFRGRIDHWDLSPFLRQEWKEKKRGKVYFYRRLSAFFGERFPDIRLAADLEKDLLIRSLEGSASADEARGTLRRLCRLKNLTDEERIDIAAASAGHLAWIEGDRDLRDRLREIVDGHEDRLDPQSREKLAALLGIGETATSLRG